MGGTSLIPKAEPELTLELLAPFQDSLHPWESCGPSRGSMVLESALDPSLCDSHLTEKVCQAVDSSNVQLGKRSSWSLAQSCLPQ